MGIIRLTSQNEVSLQSANEIKDYYKLAESKRYTARLKAAQDKNCPQEILRKLAKDKILDVRQAVAGNINVPDNLLNELAEDNSRLVNSAAITNPKCPLETIEKIIDKDMNYIFFNHMQYEYNIIAQREDCTAEILRKIAESDPYIVDNPGASYNPSGELIEERVNIIMNHRNCNDEIAEALCKYGRAYVLYHEKCPKSILEKHSEDDDYIKSIIAERRDCPANILEKLSKDKNKDIRQTVAKNRNCPTRILNALINDPRKEVRVKALKNIKERNNGPHM